VSEGGWFRRLVRRSRPRAIGLRRRILLIITLGTITLSLLLAITTYGLARSNLLQQREEVAISTSRRNAQGVQRDLSAGQATSVSPALEALERIGVQRFLIWYREEWTGGAASYGPEAVPVELVDQVIDRGENGWQVVEVGNELNIVVGWDVPQVGSYFEFFSLDEVDSTLSSVRLSLVLAAAITTLLGLLLGLFAARRAVRPLGTAAQAASAIRTCA
jgi:two-component system sensor histidine kinase MtrB